MLITTLTLALRGLLAATGSWKDVMVRRADDLVAWLAYISTITITLPLLTYDLFVRSTFIGWVLNGRRRERVMLPWVLGGTRRLWAAKNLRPLTKLEGDVPAP